MDRGYPGKDILHQIVATGHHFIVRMVASEAGGSWPVVRDFLATGATSTTVLVPLGLGDATSLTRVRLIRRNHPDDGQPLVIMAHLPNDAAYIDDQILAVYDARWTVEILYRDMKALANIEAWHGRRKLLIEQEIYAYMIWAGIANTIACRSETRTNAAEAAGNTKRHRRVNTRRLYEVVAYTVEALFIAAQDDGTHARHVRGRVLEGIKRLDAWQQKKRPDRHAPRRPKHPYARRLTH
jgi:hypothetical protein